MSQDPCTSGASGRPNQAGSERELAGPELSFWRVLWADYRQYLTDRPENPTRSLMLAPVRYLVNPSLQFALLVRIAQHAPGPIHHIVRWLQIVMFSSEIYWFRGGPERIRIGPGVSFPHPYGLLFGAGTIVGHNVTIYNNVTLGSDRAGPPELQYLRSPAIGDGVVIYGYVTILGPHRVGADAVVGHRVLLNEDIPAGALKTTTRLRPAGEWSRTPSTG
jgi:serine acetyltransferase